MNNEGDGTVTRCYKVTFERQSKHSASRVWRAITDSTEIEQWMGYPARFDLRAGGEWEIDFSSTNGGPFHGVVIRVAEEKVLAYTYGLTVMEWTLESRPDGGCNYTFVQNGLPDRGEGEEGLIAGWHEFMEHLDAYLDGHRSTHEARHDRWEALLPRYRQQLERTVRG